MGRLRWFIIFGLFAVGVLGSCSGEGISPVTIKTVPTATPFRLPAPDDPGQIMFDAYNRFFDVMTKEWNTAKTPDDVSKALTDLASAVDAFEASMPAVAPLNPKIIAAGNPLVADTRALIAVVRDCLARGDGQCHGQEVLIDRVNKDRLDVFHLLGETPVTKYAA
jgi:hypothetical protein